MSKVSNVVGVAAIGLSSQGHPYWPDCNPIKRQGVTREEQHAYHRKIGKMIKKGKEATKGKRILPALF